MIEDYKFVCRSKNINISGRIKDFMQRELEKWEVIKKDLSQKELDYYTKVSRGNSISRGNHLSPDKLKVFNIRLVREELNEYKIYCVYHGVTVTARFKRFISLELETWKSIIRKAMLEKENKKKKKG